MRSEYLWLMTAVLIFCGPYTAHANEVIIPASKDVTLFGGTTDAGNNSTSSGPGMFVGTDGTSAPKRGLIDFDIASKVPHGATITSAALTLYLGQVAGSGGGSGAGSGSLRTINLYTVSKSWNGSVAGTAKDTNPNDSIPASGFGGAAHGYAPNAGDATWNYAMYNTSAWTTPGGDFSSTVSSSFAETTAPNTSTPPAYTWASTPQMVLNVQSWLDGTTANNGWMLKNTNESSSQTFRAFYTAEGAAEQNVPQYAPELTVDFTPAPEPCSALLLMAIPMLIGRRLGRARL